MLKLSDIVKTYNQGDVSRMCLFDGFHLTIDDGEFVSIVGSNGSGKTSLLNIICGDIDAERGDIVIDDESVGNLPSFRRYKKIGRVYQNPAMGTCSHLTIMENMALADNKGRPFGLSFAIRGSRTDFYRESLRSLGLGLEDKLDLRVGALSGGQRQALALIMATLTPIDFLILDEHTAALDPKTADLIMELTNRVVREKKLSAMMVTHNLRYAVEYGSRLIMMDKGQIVLDKRAQEKANMKVEDILDIFTAISIECGN